MIVLLQLEKTETFDYTLGGNKIYNSSLIHRNKEIVYCTWCCNNLCFYLLGFSREAVFTKQFLAVWSVGICEPNMCQKNVIFIQLPKKLSIITQKLPSGPLGKHAFYSSRKMKSAWKPIRTFAGVFTVTAFKWKSFIPIFCVILGVIAH